MQENAPLWTRLAPTPSGYLHLGNVASFLYTMRLARRHGWKVLLRIDDLDRARYRRRYLEDIFRVIEALKLPIDAGPSTVGEQEKDWSQQQRLPLYRATWEQLRQQGLLFACACSRRAIRAASADGGYPGTCRGRALPLASGPPLAWRLRSTPGPVALPDLQGTPQPAPLPASLRDFIVRRRDGLPAYQLASLADDLHFGINRIVRGADLHGSSLAQWQLQELLGQPWSGARFVHHPLLLGPGGQKLAKSQKAAPVTALWASAAGRKQFWRSLRGFLEEMEP